MPGVRQTSSGVVQTTTGVVDTRAIPDSGGLHAGYGVQYQPESGTDTVDTLLDQSDNGRDMSAVGDPTLDDDAFGGNPAIILDGGDDGYIPDGSWGTLSQPFTIYAVVELDAASLSGHYSIVEETDDTGSDRAILDWPEGNWRIWASDSVDGSTDETINMLTGIYDGADSELFESTSSTATGDPGDNDLTDPSIGYRQVGPGRYWDGKLMEILFYDSAHDASTRSEVWSYLQNQHGLT